MLILEELPGPGLLDPRLQDVVLTHRDALEPVGEQQPVQPGVSGEDDAEQLPGLALVPVGTAVHARAVATRGSSSEVALHGHAFATSIEYTWSRTSKRWSSGQSTPHTNDVVGEAQRLERPERPDALRAERGRSTVRISRRRRGARPRIARGRARPLDVGRCGRAAQPGATAP